MESMEVSTVESSVVNDEEKHKKPVESIILDSFWKLSDEKENVRLNSAQLLLQKLIYKQEICEKSGEPCNELKYVVQRLVKGLAATREHSRQGFYVALVEVLRTFGSVVGATDVLALVNTHLKSSKAFSKTEKTHLSTGHILANGALIRSGAFKTATADQQNSILRDLVEHRKKRDYLSVLAFSFLMDLLTQVDEDLFRDTVWPVMSTVVCVDWESQSLDTLLFLITSRKLFRGVVKKKLIKECLHHGDILHPETFSLCGKVLMNVTQVTEVVHPIYKEVGLQIASRSDVISFWKDGIDPLLAKGNYCRLVLALELLNHILPNLQDKNEVLHFLTPNFVKLWLRLLSTSKDRGLDRRTKQILKLLGTILQDGSVTSETQVEVIRRLYVCPGNIQFERISGLHLTHQVIPIMRADGVRQLILVFRDIVLGKEFIVEEEKRQYVGNSERLYASHLVVRLITHPTMAQDLDWKLEHTVFLLHCGLIHVNDKKLFSPPHSPIGAELSQGIRESFYRSLDHKPHRLSDLCMLLQKIAEYIDKLLKSPEKLVMYKKVDDKAMDEWHRLMVKVKKIQKKEGPLSQLFLIFFIHMGLQLFSDETLALDAMQDLHQCYERAHQKNSGETDDLHWTAVVVDLLLSLLSQSKHLLRSLANHIFAELTPHMTPSAIAQVLQVLNPAHTKDTLLDRSEKDDSDESGDEDGKDGDDDKDVDSDSESEKESTLPEEDLSEESDLEDMEETVDDKFRAAIRTALGDSAGLTDTESVDMDEMDEQEVERVDTALSSAFKILRKSRENNKKKQSKDDEALMHFRTRVLDLLDIYIQSSPPAERLLELIMPLLTLLEFSIKDRHQKPLENRVRASLKKLASVKKFTNLDTLQPQVVIDLMKHLHERTEHMSTMLTEVGTELSQCCAFLVRCAIQMQSENVKTEHVQTPKKNKAARDGSDINLSEEIIGVYKATLNKFFEKRDCLLPPTFFRAVLHLAWQPAWDLVEMLSKFAFLSSIRPFRRTQALQLLSEAFQNHGLLSAVKEKDKIAIPENIAHNAVQLLNSAAEAGKDAGVKQKFICELMVLLRVLHRSKLMDEMDKEDVGKAMVLYRSKEGSSLSQDTRKAYLRLATCLHIKVKALQVQSPENGSLDSKEQAKKKKKKRKNSNETTEDGNSTIEADGKVEKKKKKKKKGKKNKETLKERKEGARLRLTGLSSGLDDLSFSGLKEEFIGEKTTSRRNKRKKTKEDVNGHGDTELLTTKKIKQNETNNADGDSSYGELQQSVVDVTAKKRKKQKMR